MSITCGNFGPDGATGPVSLKVVTPFFLNISLPTGDQLAGGTAEFLYRNPAPNVPSLMQVKFDGCAADEEKVVKVPVNLASTPEFPFPPNVSGIGAAIFTTDLQNTEDNDVDLSRNARPWGTVRSLLNSPTPGNVNLVYTYTMKDLQIGGSAGAVPFHFQNKAATALQGTRSDAYFTFTTPYYSRVPQAGRPTDLEALYENDDPAIPSIYRLRIAPGLGRDGLERNTGRTVDIPFQVQEGAPQGSLAGTANIFCSGEDSQGDLSNVHHLYSVVSDTLGPA